MSCTRTKVIAMAQVFPELVELGRVTTKLEGIFNTAYFTHKYVKKLLEVALHLNKGEL